MVNNLPGAWMKGRGACAVLVVLFLLAGRCAARAQLLFTTNNGAITITGYTGSNGVVVIPDTIDGYPVTGIGQYAFAGGYYAVGNSTYVINLTNVMFGTNVNTIGYGAFVDNLELDNMVIPDQVTNIGAYAFEYCAGLTNVTIGAKVVTIGKNAFASCDGLTNVFIPKSATNIGAEAFVQCENLAGINVDALNPFYSSSNGFLFDKHQTALIEAPGTVAGNYIIPGSVTNIATGAFMDCANLTGVVISNRVAIVGTNAFTGCTGLSNILIGTNVLGIAMSAFQGCSGLTDATIPRSVVRLGAGVFNDCSSLTNVLIHSGVTNIESGLEGLASFDLRILSLNAIQVAGDCPRLMAITVTGTSLYYSSTNGILFNQPQTVLLEAPGGFAGGYTVPETVTNIAPGAFNACTNLTSLVIPNRVISIGGGAFDACGGLTNVVIGTNVTSIGQKAFSFCGALGTVAIPAGVTNIGDGALTGCRSLTNISVDPKNLYYSSFNGFLFDKHFTRLIQAPGGYAGNYTVPNSVTNIGDEAFENCSNLRDVTLGANISSIGNQAFFECNNLMSLFFKGNAPSAASMVFGGVARRLPPIIGGQPLLLTPPVIYYLPGAQGWSATFGGQPAVPWNLQVQTGGAGLGVRTNRFGFNITGSSDVEIVVEACTNLTKPNWLPVQTNVLTEGATYFSDAQWTNYPGRYYRFRSE